jgi:hypothetical protein
VFKLFVAVYFDVLAPKGNARDYLLCAEHRHSLARVELYWKC